jgi:opacity protein-like surface antigen
MRKIICITILLSIYQMANAQIKLGLRIAPQLTWSKNDNKVTTTNGTRVNAGYGLMIDYYFSDNYAIGTEFSLQSFGTNMNIKESKFTNITSQGVNYPATDDLKYNYKLNYLQVPVILKMRTKEIGYLRYFAEFGFAANFLTRAKADISMGSTFEKEKVNINNPDDEDDFRLAPNDYDTRASAFRAGLILGAGIQYNIFGNSLLVAGLRYDNGFSNFVKDDKLKTNLSYVALNIGVLF